jgi:hypothetical protein
VSPYPTIFYSQVLGGGLTTISPVELLTLPVVRGRKYEIDSSAIFNEAANAGVAPAASASNPTSSIYLNNSSLILGLEQINPYGEDLTVTSKCGWLPQLNLVAPTTSLSPSVDNAYCVPTVDQFFQPEAYLVPAINPIAGGDFDPSSSSTRGPVTGLNFATLTGGTGGATGTYNGVTTTTGGLGTGATVNVTIGFTSLVGPISALGGIAPSGTGTVVDPGGAIYTANVTGVATSVFSGPPGTGATANVTVSSTASNGPINSLNAGSLVPGSGSVSVAGATYTNTLNNVPATFVSGTNGTGATLNVTVQQTAGVGPADILGAPFNVVNDAPGPNNYLGLSTTTSGAGTGLTVDVATDVAGAPTAVTIANAGIGYAAGDTVTVAFGTGSADLLVTNVLLPIAVSSVALSAPGTGYDSSSVVSALAANIDGVSGFAITVSDVVLTLQVTAATLNAPGSGYNTTSVLNIAAAGGVTGARVAVASVTLPTGITAVAIANGGLNYNIGDTLNIPSTGGALAATIDVATVTSSAGVFTNVTTYPTAAGLLSGYSSASAQAVQSRLVGVAFNVLANGVAPDGTTAVNTGDTLVLTYNGTVYEWVAIAPAADGGDLTSVGQVCYGSQIEMVFTPEQTPPSALWRFDAITSTEIIDRALRGVGFNGVPQAVFVEAGIDNVNRLYDDSQRYFNPFGFIAYYGPYIQNGAGQWIPPSPYVTGVAVRRYRAEGYQFPPAGVKYQLADAVAAQIPINSAQQNLLNPDGCNAVRTLPGYPQTAVFIWGGRTRVNTKDAQQRLYQFVNTRVILNVVYGSLRTAFDSQIFNVIDGFGVVFNQIISVGNSVLNQLYVRGALFGARPSNAFQVICDRRINSDEDLENGIVNAKVFVTPVPTLERIQIDLIRVAIGKMQQELDVQGLGQSNA